MNIYGNWPKPVAKPSFIQTYLTLLGKETKYKPLTVYEITKGSTDGTFSKGNYFFFAPEGKTICGFSESELIASDRDYTAEMLDFEAAEVDAMGICRDEDGKYRVYFKSLDELD